MTSTGTSFVKIAKIIGALVGFMLVLGGVNAMVQAKKRQEGIGLAVFTILIGAALLSASALASLGSNSVMGGEANDTAIKALDI